MRTVKDMIAELRKFPMDSLVYAYEGEDTGIVVRDKNDRKELGFIPAKPMRATEMPTQVYAKKR